LDPRTALESERNPHPIQPGRSILAPKLRPLREGRRKRLIDRRGPPAPMILPREEPIPVAPDRLERRNLRPLRRKPEIADRNQPRALGGIAKIGLRQFPPPVAEGVELLDIAGLETGLSLHPVAQAKLEGAVFSGVEPAVRQPGFPAVAGDQHI